MNNDKLSLKSFRKIYKTENTCLQTLLDIRMPEKECFTEYCTGRTDIDFRRFPKKKAFYCRKCFGRLHPCTDSFLENGKIELQEVFEVIYRMISSRNGISAREICDDFGFSYPTAYALQSKIMRALGECLDFHFDNTAVEVDEVYINTSTKGLGKEFKDNKRGRGSYIQTPVLGIAERNGRARMFVLLSVDRDTIFSHIRELVSKSCPIYTDENPVYTSLSAEGYKHEFVVHRLEEWTKGSASTNTAENLFYNLKRIIHSHKYVTETQLQEYCDLVSFQHSYRDDNDYGFMRLLNRLRPLSLNYGYLKPAA